MTMVTHRTADTTAVPIPYKYCNGQLPFLYLEQVLVDELDYLAEEVDDMDPQIAAVVIEKSLPRPRAGEHLRENWSYIHPYGTLISYMCTEYVQ